jgi:hypothetical protein
VHGALNRSSEAAVASPEFYTRGHERSNVGLWRPAARGTLAFSPLLLTEVQGLYPRKFFKITYACRIDDE